MIRSFKEKICDVLFVCSFCMIAYAGTMVYTDVMVKEVKNHKVIAIRNIWYKEKVERTDESGRS